MPDTVRPHLPLIRVLASSNKQRRKKLIDILTRREVNCIAEMVLNGVAGEARSQLAPECIRHCRLNRRAVRSLAYDRLPWQRRRDILKSQVGKGWFAPLLSAVLTSLGTQNE